MIRPQAGPGTGSKEILKGRAGPGSARAAPAAGANRLKHIAHLGVSTFGWSFAVHGQQPPGAQPFVELEGPGGRWTWGEPGDDAIRGPARDFCLVVTQRRNVQDTALQVTGATAAAWMALAQCFAGEPALGRHRACARSGTPRPADGGRPP